MERHCDLLRKNYFGLIFPVQAESLKKKLQSDRFQNFCSRLWASELLSIFCAGPSPALVCQSLGLALIPPAFRNFGRKRPVRVRHIGYRGPQKVLPTFANFFFSSKKSDFPIFSEFAKKNGIVLFGLDFEKKFYQHLKTYFPAKKLGPRL